MTRPLPIRACLAGLALLCALLAVVPAASPAASRDQIIEDCADDGRLQGNYSASEVRDARKNLPSDVAEYTDCADVLRRAELPQDSGGGSGGGTGGGVTGGGGTVARGAGSAPEILTPATDSERRSLENAASGAAPVEVGGRTIVPGAAGFSPNATQSDLPWSLLIALLAVALLAAAMAVPAVRRHVPWHRLGRGRGA